MSVSMRFACISMLALPSVAAAVVPSGTLVITIDDGLSDAIGTISLPNDQYTQTGVFSALAGQAIDGLTYGNGTLYGAATNGNLYTLTTTGGSSQLGSVSTASPGFFGLADSGSGFLADTSDYNAPLNLLSINSTGTNQSIVGQMLGSGYDPSSNLVYGPGGTLYLGSAASNSGPDLLFSVNPSTGATTEIGSMGASTPLLALASNGVSLYGFDVTATSNIGIYSINTTTGAATEIGTIGNWVPGYEVDAATFIPAPEPASLSLLAIGALGLLGRRRRPSIV